MLIPALDASFAAVSALLSRGSSEVHLGPNLGHEGSFKGTPVRLRCCAFRGGNLAWARVVRLDGGSQVQAFNFVALPKTDSMLPVLACSVLGLARGVHLCVLDAHGLGADVDRDFIEGLEAARSGGTAEAHRVREDSLLSPQAVVLREKEAPIDLPRFLTAVEALTTKVLEPARLNGLEPVRDSIRAQARLRYLERHVREEPTGPFLVKIYGEQWATDFVRRFLFPEWLVDDQAPPPF